MTDRSFNAGPPRRVLPVVLDMCRRINGVFVEYVGPVAHEIADDIYERWLEHGDTGPSGVAHYIHLLSENVVDDKQRSSFQQEALDAMRQALRRRS